jgi:hypothetical protein
MSAASVQFVELVRLEYARIEQLKQAASDRGEVIENLTAAWLDRGMDEATRDDLIARLCAGEGENE